LVRIKTHQNTVLPVHIVLFRLWGADFPQDVLAVIVPLPDLPITSVSAHITNVHSPVLGGAPAPLPPGALAAHHLSPQQLRSESPIANKGTSRLQQQIPAYLAPSQQPPAYMSAQLQPPAYLTAAQPVTTPMYVTPAMVVASTMPSAPIPVPFAHTSAVPASV
jgi:hypothetical protein